MLIHGVLWRKLEDHNPKPQMSVNGENDNLGVHHILMQKANKG